MEYLKMTTKFKNFAKIITSSFKVLALFLSIWTMTFSTVALGAQSEKRLKEVQNFILDSGLNKKTTYKEFWNNTKHIYPGEVYKKVEKFFLANPNAIMPKFAVREVTNSKGEKTIALSIDGDGKSHQVQILAQPEKWATFDNVALTPADINLLEPALVKIQNGMNPKNKSKAAAQFQGYPTIDKASWKKMTPIERAQHIVNLRALWSASIEVLEVSEKSKAKANSKSETSSLDKWNLFISFINQEAFANKVGEACVVAGYIGSYAKSKRGLTCNYPVGEGRGSCKTPCNPVIYGYGAGGGEICVANRGELQTATHWNGACDKASPLTIAELSLPKPKNEPRVTEQYKAILDQNKAEALSPENKDKNLKLTENYLNSMLGKNADPSFREMFEKGEFSDKLLAQLKKIESNFNATIIQGQNICASVSDGKLKPDAKFYPACDQLHKRFLFVREYLQEKCPSGSALDNNLKCECSNDKTKTLNPNSKDSCEKVVVAPPVVAPAPVEEVKNKCPLSYSHLELDQDCKCVTTKSPPVRNLKSVSGESEFTCETQKDDKAFNWTPVKWIAGAIGVTALLALLLGKDKDKKKKPAPVLPPPPQPTPPPAGQPPVVPPPVIPPPACTNVCEANSTRNDTTCVCTPNWTPANCAVTYDAEVCPSEGGSGDSCPSGDCSGGVPGAVSN